MAEHNTPALGGWFPGDPAGERRFAEVAAGRPFQLEGGGRLDEVVLAYETWGELDADASNAVLVCHALTGDSHVRGRADDAHPTPGWWEDVVGPGRGLDPSRYFIVCANVLGGCQGSTGPTSTHPDGAPYGSRFPVVTIRDMVRSQAGLADALGIRKWLAVVGGSMGGMQALEWAVMFPDRVASLAMIASAPSASALQIAWSHVGRLAVTSDPDFRGGDYYDHPPGPVAGVNLGRQIGQIHYRTGQAYQNRFGRSLSTMADGAEFSLDRAFDVESYLNYQGQKFVGRFDANSYLRVNRAMDLHDIGRGRGGVDTAMRRIHCPTMIMSVSSDTLYPPHEQLRVYEGLRSNGVRVGYVEIESDDGHDGFLLEGRQVSRPLEAFLDAQWDARTLGRFDTETSDRFRVNDNDEVT